MLKREGIQFQICKNPDIKCSVIERAHCTIRDKLFKYFIFKNTYKFINKICRRLQRDRSRYDGHGARNCDGKRCPRIME